MSSTINPSKDPGCRCLQCGDVMPAGSAQELCEACLLWLASRDAAQAPASAASPDLRSLLTSPQCKDEVGLHQFNDYELIEEVARGGMGVVISAYQISVGRIVALKFLTGKRMDSEEARRRFQLEVHTTALLDHPNIVPVYEAGEQDGCPFLCLKYIEGGTLGDALRGGGFRQPYFTKIPTLLIKIARAVHYAHEQGICHRDLKPSNILLDRDGDPYVTDFGLAKLRDVDGSLTRSNAAMGTPRYMSPEQCRSDGAGVSAASDIFSLGAILYEIICGQPPFEGDTTLEVMRKVAEENPPPLRLGGRERDLANICLKCLEKEPRRRYASALALAEDLERYARGEPVLARPVGKLEQATKWARRYPALAAMTAATALVMMIGTAVSLWQAHTAKSAMGTLAENLYAADMADAFRKFDEGRREAARELLRRHFPKPGRADLRGWEWRWLWSQTESREQWLFQDGSRPVRVVQAAPRGEAIVFGTLDGAFFWYDLTSRDVRLIHQTVGAEHVAAAIDFSHDGKWLALTTVKYHWTEKHTERNTFVYALDQGYPDKHPLRVKTATLAKDMPSGREVALKAQIWRVTRFVTDPDGRTKLIVSGQIAGLPALRVWDFQAGDDALRDLCAVSNERVTISPDGRLIVAVDAEAEGPDAILLYQTLSGNRTSFRVPWTGKITETALSSDGKKLAVRGEEQPTMSNTTYFGGIFSVSDGTLIQTLVTLTERHEHFQFIGEALTTTDGREALQYWMAAADDSTRLLPGKRLPGFGSPPNTVDPLGEDWMVTGNRNGALRMWSLATTDGSTNEQRTVEGARTFPLPVKLSADAAVLAASTGNPNDPYEVGIWNVRSGKQTHRVHGLPVWMSPDGDQLVTARYETPANPLGYVDLGAFGAFTILAFDHIDLSKAAPELVESVPVIPPLSGITAMGFWPDGSRAAAGTATGEIFILDYHSGETAKLQQVTEASISGIAISKNARYLAYAGQGSGIYDLYRNQVLKEFPPGSDRINQASFSPDSRYYLRPTLTGAVDICDLTTLGMVVKTLHGHTAAVRSIAFTPDGKTCATYGETAAGRDRVVKLWNVRTWREIGTIPSTWTVQFSSDGHSLITDGYPIGDTFTGRLTIRTVPDLEAIDAEEKRTRFKK